MSSVCPAFCCSHFGTLSAPWEPTSCCSFLYSPLGWRWYIGVGVTASPGISGSHSHTCVKRARDGSLVLAQLQTRRCQAHLRQPAYMHAKEWGYDQALCNVPRDVEFSCRLYQGPGPTVDKYTMSFPLCLQKSAAHS